MSSVQPPIDFVSKPTRILERDTAQVLLPSGKPKAPDDLGHVRIDDDVFRLAIEKGL